MGDDQQGHRSHLKLPGVGGLPSVGSFGVGGFVSDRLNDAVGLLSALPEMAVTLRSINTHIINVDTEVALMRQGVNRLEHDVEGIRHEIEQLRVEISSVNAHVEQMGVRLENMEPNIESIGRVAGLLRRNRRKGRDNEPTAIDAGGTESTGEALGTQLEDLDPVAATEELSEAAQQLLEATQAVSVSAHPVQDGDELGFQPPYGTSEPHD
jgi:septal ring factor EnvC (AmiA/AmiB activator)